MTRLPAPLRADDLAGVRRVLVDGGSGSGKTQWATRLAHAWQELGGEPVQLVSLDSFYPGWQGLAEGSRLVVDDVLRPRDPGYRTWDWERRAPGGWVALDPDVPMVVEGCGALTPASAPLVGLRIWLEMGEPRRRQRALARDGDAYAPHWEEWAAQERRHWQAHQPWLLADVVVPEHLLS